MPSMLDIPNPDSAGESPAQIVLAPSSSSWPTLFAARPEARHRLRDFFNSHIRNRNTRRAYMEAVRQFAALCAELGITDLAYMEAVHVAAFVERRLQTNSRPTVKLRMRLAALRMLFDWMVWAEMWPSRDHRRKYFRKLLKITH